MDLKKRLASLDRLSRRPGGNSVVEQPAVDPDDTARTLGELGLTAVDTPAGTVWRRDCLDPVPSFGDRLPALTGLFTRAGEVDPAPEDLLFLDTETTGLAGGTGTHCFLVGASRLTSEGLATRQYFLPGPGREVALLTELAGMASSCGAVVTFNGASFDLPLLRTRALLNRLPDPLRGLSGWDLLVPVRRLWGRRLPDCRQQTLEKEICGLTVRDGDIDGGDIPGAWFDFVAGGGPGLLPAVLHHNRLDMAGMAHILARVVEAAAGLGRPAEPGRESLCWQDAWSRGRICEIRRDSAAAAAWLESALRLARRRVRGCPNPRFVADAIRILKRGGDPRIVQEAVEWGLARGLDEPWLRREAAILFEHRLVDLQAALAHAEHCGDDHRVARLLRKLAERERRNGR